MLVLKEYKHRDIHSAIVNFEEWVTEAEIKHYEKHCYLRTFIDTETNEVVAVGMVQKCGEIGLLVNNTLILKHIRKFYTLLVVYAAEAFAFIDTDRLFTGIKPNLRDKRWIRFLGFTLTDTDPDHAALGWTTYELPLSRWVL